MVQSIAKELFLEPPSLSVVSSFGKLFDDFATAVLGCLDSSAAKALNDTTGGLWPILKQSIKKAFSSGQYVLSELSATKFSLPRLCQISKGHPVSQPESWVIPTLELRQTIRANSATLGRRKLNRGSRERTLRTFVNFWN